MSKAISLFLAGITGVGTPGIVGAYFRDQKTIWDQLSEEVIPNNSDSSLESVWSFLREKLNKNNQVTEGEAKSLKDQKNDTNGQAIKNWCFSSYEKIFSSWFQKEDKKTLEDVKTICQKTIEEQLDSNKIEILETEEGNKDVFEPKVSSLEKHNEETQGVLEKELKVIKNKENGSDWKVLKKWCKETYKKGYQGEKSNRWKLANLYCNKTTSNTRKDK